MLGKMVVTGAAGFVGSVLATRASEQGWSVYALDNKSRGLNPIWEVGAVGFREWDCLEGLPPDLEDADVVVHLAAGTGSLERSLTELRELNVAMTQRVYRSAHNTLFIWPTTSLALGVPDSPYVKSKEEALSWVRLQKNAVPLRFFNVTGAYRGFTERRQNEVHLIPRLVHCAVSGDLFTINGENYDTIDGTPSRDFVNVVNVSDYILWLARGGQATPAPDGAIWCGTGKTTTVGQTIECLPALQKHRLKLRHGPRRKFDVGALQCLFSQSFQMAQALGGYLTPPHESVTDEINALIPLADRLAVSA